MADVSSSGSTVDSSDVQDWDDILRMLAETDGNVGKLYGEDGEGFAPPRDLSEVSVSERPAEGGGSTQATVVTVREAAERLRQSELDEDVDVEEERSRDEGVPEALDLQRGFVYPLPVFGNGSDEQEEGSGEGEDEAEDDPTRVDDTGGEPVDPYEVRDLGVEGPTMPPQSVRMGASGDPYEIETDQLDSTERAPGGPEGGSGLGAEEDGSALGESHPEEQSEGGYAAVQNLLKPGERFGGSEPSAVGVTEPADLVEFIRAGLEPGEKAVYDRLIASFSIEALAGESTAYDFLLLCGFTATITRRVPRQLYDAVKGVDERLLREVKVLQTGISQATTEMVKVSAIPEELVKVAGLLEEMAKRTDFHLVEERKLYSETLKKFTASLDRSIAGVGKAGDKMVAEIWKKAQPHHWINRILYILLSFAMGVALTTLLEAASWQRLKVAALAEADTRAGEEAEAFRKKVDAAQPAQSILARLEENGLVVSGQRGSFTDLLGVGRKAFILSVRSAGPEKLSQVDRSERRADLYFSEP
jgi:hypothetical protein